jgi:hypothetical protein
VGICIYERIRGFDDFARHDSVVGFSFEGCVSVWLEVAHVGKRIRPGISEN